MDILKEIPLLKSLNDVEKRILADMVEEYEIKDDSIILEQGKDLPPK